PMVLNRTLRPLRQPRVYAVLVIGLVLLMTWIVAVKLKVSHTDVIPDTGGVAEAERRLFNLSFKTLPLALLLPVIVIASGFPASLALILPFHPGLRSRFRPDHQQLLLALAGAIIASFAIGLFAGMTNPRYAYPTLPLLAPLVGAVAYGWRRGLGQSW